MLAFGLVNVAATRPFYAGDETAGANYALEVTGGRLPVFDDRFPPRVPGMSDALTTTAVHPPLYYLLAGLPLHLGVATGHPLAGLWVARLLTLALAVATVALTARLGDLLLPRRPDVVVAGAGLLALTTSFHQVSALVYNDALFLLATTATLVAVVELIRRGSSRARRARLVVAATVAAATRASGLELVVLAAGAAVAAALVGARAAGTPVRLHLRLRPALGQAGAVGPTAVAVVAAPVLAVGWFYVRNLQLYGDLDGSSRALRAFPEPPLAWGEALSGGFWLGVYRQGWGGVTGGDALGGLTTVAADALLVAVVAGVALAGWHGLRRARSRPGIWPGSGTWSGARLGAWPGAPLGLAWVAMAAHVVLVVAGVLSYLNRGGIPFVRYFFPVLPLLVLVGALGLSALPGGRSGTPTVAALLVVAATDLAVTGRVLGRMVQSPPSDAFGRLTAALAANGVPVPRVFLAALAAVLVAGLWLVGSSVVALGRSAATRTGGT